VAYELGKQIGLQDGDKIVKINGKNFSDFDDITSSKVFLGSNSYYTVERGGQLIDVQIPNDFIEKLSDKKNAGLFLAPAQPFQVKAVRSGMPADAAGLKPGDKITAINGTPTAFFHHLQKALSEQRVNKCLLQCFGRAKNYNLLLM
jgi:regulator of sigma E protease